MELVEIRQLYRNNEQYIGKSITVGGWVRSVRILRPSVYCTSRWNLF